MEKFELVKEILDNMSESDLFWLYKEYVCQAQLYDDEIFDMNEFDEIMCASTPTDIALKIFYGDFRPNDNYFKFDGCANLQSFDYISDEVDLEEIADYIVDNDEDFDNSDIREILGEDDEEDEMEIYDISSMKLIQSYWLDSIIFLCCFEPSEELRKKYDLSDSNVLYVEYWDDEGSCHYYIHCEDDTIYLNKQCNNEKNNNFIETICKASLAEED